MEVEDNGDDEEMWMQTTKGVVRKRGLEEGEQLAEDEREAKQLKSEDRNSEEYQLQERAREEEAQEREDEALWQQHLGGYLQGLGMVGGADVPSQPAPTIAGLNDGCPGLGGGSK